MKRHRQCAEHRVMSGARRRRLPRQRRWRWRRHRRRRERLRRGRRLWRRHLLDALRRFWRQHAALIAVEADVLHAGRREKAIILKKPTNKLSEGKRVGGTELYERVSL